MGGATSQQTQLDIIFAKIIKKANKLVEKAKRCKNTDIELKLIMEHVSDLEEIARDIANMDNAIKDRQDDIVLKRDILRADKYLINDMSDYDIEDLFFEVYNNENVHTILAIKNENYAN